MTRGHKLLLALVTLLLAASSTASASRITVEGLEREGRISARSEGKLTFSTNEGSTSCESTFTARANRSSPTRIEGTRFIFEGALTTEPEIRTNALFSSFESGRATNCNASTGVTYLYTLGSWIKYLYGREIGGRWLYFTLHVLYLVDNGGIRCLYDVGVYEAYDANLGTLLITGNVILATRALAPGVCGAGIRLAGTLILEPRLTLRLEP